MNDTTNKPLIEDGILDIPASPFGGTLAPVVGHPLPDPNDRADEATVETSAGEGHGETGDTTGVQSFPTEMTDAGEQHTIVGSHVDTQAGNAENERAVEGHNEPPMDRDEMLKDMWKDVTSYGRDSGKGAAALPRLGLRVIRAAADGLISTEKPKDGSKSDAVRIYERYAEQDSKHAEHTKGGMKANAAKLNALIGLGCMTTVDGVEVASRAVSLREKMEENDQKPKALFAALVDVARKQMESDTPLTDDAIETAMGKTVKDKSVAEEWTAIHKRIEKLITGENAQGLKDQSETATKIEELVREHMNQFAQASADDEMVAFCMERGMSRADAQAFVAARS